MRKKDMTSGVEWKLILSFTIPIMLTNLLQQFYNTVDGVVVGNFAQNSDLALSAVGTCAGMTMLFLAFAMGLSVGSGVVVSQYYGAQRYDDLAVVVDTSLILLTIFGVIISILGAILTPVLLVHVLRVPETILPMAQSYLRIYCVGLVFQFIYNCAAFILRAVGDSKASLYFLIISTALNVVLDTLFVVAFHWDVPGVAWATVFAQLGCAAASYAYLRRKFPFVKGGRHFDGGLCKIVLRVGLPTAVQQSIVSFGNIAMQRLVNGFGEACMGAYTVGSQIMSFVFVPVVGFQSGLANFAGQNIGAGRFDRVKRGYHATMLMSLIVTVAFCIALKIFAEPIIGLFGLTDPLAVAMGVEQIQFLTWFFWFFALYMTLGGVLQGAGDTVLQSAATLSALIIRIVLGYAGVHFGWFGYAAAWSTNPIGWAAAVLITNIRYFTGGWKKKVLVSRGDAPRISD
jgi:putative MATE family efflux protein